jgi:hypothetical protein
LEEERRLAYVAWTRARSSLVLVYDPSAPSQFLREAFEPAELGLEPAELGLEPAELGLEPADLPGPRAPTMRT